MTTAKVSSRRLLERRLRGHRAIGYTKDEALPGFGPTAGERVVEYDEADPAIVRGLRQVSMRRRGSHDAKSRGSPRKALTRVELEAMTQAATIDCYNESEEITGWFTVIEENLATPFETPVLGATVTVERIELNEAGEIVAICSRGPDRQRLPILDLPLPRLRPVGSEWIEAYRRWLGGR